jgi:hypothetical protein
MLLYANLIRSHISEHDILRALFLTENIFYVCFNMILSSSGELGTIPDPHKYDILMALLHIEKIHGVCFKCSIFTFCRWLRYSVLNLPSFWSWANMANLDQMAINAFALALNYIYVLYSFLVFNKHYYTNQMARFSGHCACARDNQRNDLSCNWLPQSWQLE